MKLEQAINEYNIECDKLIHPGDYYLHLSINDALYNVTLMARKPKIFGDKELYLGIPVLTDGTKEQATNLYISHVSELRFITMTPDCLFVKHEFRITS